MSGRRPLIAGNWKMNKTGVEAREHVARLRAHLGEGEPAAEVAVCPPFTALEATARAASGSAIRVLAQAVHEKASGAHTGEVSAAMILAAGATGTIVGHSERRAAGETDAQVAARTAAALDAGLTVIMCCGESLDQREAGETEAWLTAQVRAGLAGVQAGAADVLAIAYEPIWAIGTGRTATPEIAQEACALRARRRRRDRGRRRPARPLRGQRHARHARPSCCGSPTSTAPWWAARASTRTRSPPSSARPDARGRAPRPGRHRRVRHRAGRPRQRRQPRHDAGARRLAAEGSGTRIAASGLPVGLPDGQQGNSEVGHLNLGAGRRVPQMLVRIDEAIADGSLAANPALRAALDRGPRADAPPPEPRRARRGARQPGATCWPSSAPPARRASSGSWSTR